MADFAVRMPVQYAPSLHRYYPIVGSVNELDLVPQKLATCGHDTEFCSAFTFAPGFIDAVANKG